MLAGPRLALPRRAQVLAKGGPPTWVVAPVGTKPGAVAGLRGRGVEVLLLPARRGRVRFPALLRALGARGLTSLLIEGGGTVAGEALRARAVDRLVLFMAPVLVGEEGVPAIGPLGVPRIARAVRVDDLAVARVGQDLVLEARVKLSHERNKNVLVRLENRLSIILKPIALPALFGVSLTMLFFGVLLGGLATNQTVLLQEAVSAHRGALKERTRERVPLQWAQTQDNLGNTVTSFYR